LVNVKKAEFSSFKESMEAGFCWCHVDAARKLRYEPPVKKSGGDDAAKQTPTGTTTAATK
jgi:hypothetical protein